MVISCLNFFHELVLAANPQVLVYLHENDQIFEFVKSVIEIPGENKSLKRGELFLTSKKWSPQ